jgi:hypothetical protein
MAISSHGNFKLWIFANSFDEHYHGGNSLNELYKPSFGSEGKNEYLF